MDADKLSEADESFLDHLLDRMLRARASGLAVNLEGAFVLRPHLRHHIIRIGELARSVAVSEPPSLPPDQIHETAEGASPGPSR